MGIFKEETQIEKDCNELIKDLRKLSNNYSSYDIENFIYYIKDVRDKKVNNNFYEFDFLRSVIIKCLDENKENAYERFEELTELTKFLLPYGLETEDYEKTKNMIINFKGKFNESFYALFDDKTDFIQVHNILEKELFNENINDEIMSYALDVSPYCTNQKVLKAEIISFINAIKQEGSYEGISTYSEQRLVEMKKRKGIYPIDERTLAKISREVDKAQNLIRKIEILETKIGNYSQLVTAMTKDGKKELNETILESIKELNKLKGDTVTEVQEEIKHQVEEITEKLNQYLLELKSELKDNSNKVFEELLNECQKKIDNIKLMASSLSKDTTSELLRIKKTTEESVEKLKAYVEDEPLIKEAIKDAKNNDDIKEILLSLRESISPTVVSTQTSGILIPGNDRIVVPANPSVIIPNNGFNDNILPAFDERISFKERYKVIIDKKQKREAEGEFFHSMVDEVINCLMEGDWPYLWGPSGCGKSHIIKQVAELIGIELAENGKITDKYSIMAYNDPHGKFRATQAFVALTYGKLLSLDEFDNGNPDTQVVLNELYSGLLDAIKDPSKKRYVTFAEDMTVAINPNFRMISAGNTSGEGENEVFSSRGKLDESVQERMTPKRFNYDNRVEQRIFGEYTNWYNLFVNFRKACDEYALINGLSCAPGIITTRDASFIVKYINHNSKTVDQIFREKFIQVKDNEYLGKISSVLKNIYDIRSWKDASIPDDMELSEISEKTLAKKLIHDCEKTREERKR